MTEVPSVMYIAEYILLHKYEIEQRDCKYKVT